MLNEAEAKWLMEVVHNPISGAGQQGNKADEEPSDDYEMRARFFHALKAHV